MGLSISSSIVHFLRKHNSNHDQLLTRKCTVWSSLTLGHSFDRAEHKILQYSAGLLGSTLSHQLPFSAAHPNVLVQTNVNKTKKIKALVATESKTTKKESKLSWFMLPHLRNFFLRPPPPPLRKKTLCKNMLTIFCCCMRMKGFFVNSNKNLTINTRLKWSCATVTAQDYTESTKIKKETTPRTTKNSGQVNICRKTDHVTRFKPITAVNVGHVTNKKQLVLPSNKNACYSVSVTLEYCQRTHHKIKKKKKESKP